MVLRDSGTKYNDPQCTIVVVYKRECIDTSRFYAISGNNQRGLPDLYEIGDLVQNHATYYQSRQGTCQPDPSSKEKLASGLNLFQGPRNILLKGRK